MGDSLGDRMKHNYEDRSRYCLTRRVPVIMRLDGKAFHTLTKHCEKPFDDLIIEAMQTTACCVFGAIQGAKLAYVQSDEISILISDLDTLKTEPWFDYNIQKMVSCAASEASTAFSEVYGDIGLFDARVFNIPKEEVVNYFRWRYQDWKRNSIQMLARSRFSQKQLHKKNTSDMHEMLHELGVNWADLDPRYKNGTALYYQEEVNEANELQNFVYLDERVNFMEQDWIERFDKLLTPVEK